MHTEEVEMPVTYLREVFIYLTFYIHKQKIHWLTQKILYINILFRIETMVSQN